MKKIFYATCFVVALTSAAQAQQTAPQVYTPEQEVYINVERKPQFAGGDSALFAYIKEHLEYPKDLRTDARALVEFVVRADGSITDAKILRSACKSCDEAALKLLNNMPKWVAAQQNGEAVSVKQTLPIYFKVGQ